MRTRTSWRNQDRLWKSLGGKTPPPKGESVPRCWDCRYYPRGGRVRGICALHKAQVTGSTERRECWRSREQ